MDDHDDTYEIGSEKTNMDDHEDKAMIQRKKMDVLMEGVNNHYAWLLSDGDPDSIKRRKEMQNYITWPKHSECNKNYLGQILILLTRVFENDEYDAKGRMTLIKNTITIPLHHIYHITDKGTLSMNTLRQLCTPPSILKMSLGIPSRRLFTSIIEVPTFCYAAEFFRIAGAGCSLDFFFFFFCLTHGCSLESILKRSEKKVIKAGQHSNFLASAFYSGLEDCVDTDNNTAPNPVRLFLTIPYLDWESPRNGSRKTDLPGPEFSTPAPTLGDSFSKKESEVFEGQSQRPSQGSSGSGTGPSTILTPLESQLERLTAYNLTNGQEASWKSTLSLFEYRFGFRRGFDINSIFNQGEIFDSLGMDHEAVVVRSVSFLYVHQMSGSTLVVFRSENDQQCGVLVDSFEGAYELVGALVTATERVAQLLKDELIQSFQDRISHINLLIQSRFSESQKRLFEVHTTTKIELTTITRVIEAQIQAFKNIKNYKCEEFGYPGSDDTIKKLIEEREIFKRCFEGFLAEIQSSQDLIMESMELAKMEMIRQQRELAESSLRMTEARISQEAADSEIFRARQEEMHEINMKNTIWAQERQEEMDVRNMEYTKRAQERQEEMHQINMEYTKRAQEFREETTLVFTIVTTIFLPLSFFTSYYGMNTTDMRSTTSTQHDFWTVCGPISVVVIMIALAIGCRKQIARTALYKWAKPRE